MQVLKPEAPQVAADPVKVEEVRIAAHEAETKRLEAETDRIKVENDRIKAEAELIKAKAEAYQLLCSHEKTAIVVQAGEAEGEQEGAGDAEEGDEGGQQEMPAPMSQADELRMQLLAAINGITAVAEGMNRPKTVIRDDQGRVVGLQ